MSPVLLWLHQRGSGAAHIPTGDEVHQGTGVHRLQGTLCPRDWSPFFQPAAGQRPTFSHPDSTPRAWGIVQCIDGPLSLHIPVAGHFSGLYVLAIVNRASLVPQLVKYMIAMQETRVWSLGPEYLLEKEIATHSNFLAWRIPWTEEPDRLQSMGSQRVRHDWATSLSLSENAKYLWNT